MCCPLYVQCFHSYLISSECIHCCERYCMLLHQMAVPWRPSIPTPSVHTYRLGKLLRLFLQALDHLPYRVRKLKAGCGRTLVPDYLSLMNVSSSSGGVSQPRQSQGSFCHAVFLEASFSFHTPTGCPVWYDRSVVIHIMLKKSNAMGYIT